MPTAASPTPTSAATPAPANTPISPPPLKHRVPEVLPAYLSNGILGLRVRQVPFFNGIAVINGYSGENPVVRVESAPHAPYPLGGDLRLGHVWLSQQPEAVEFQEQSYDFANGELTTRFAVTLDGMRAQVHILTFCSRTMPTLALQQVTIEVDGECDVALRASLDPTGIPGRWLARTVITPGTTKAEVDGSLRWESLGGMSSCGAAYITDLQGAEHSHKSLDEWNEQGPLVTTYTFKGEPNHRYVMHQIASMIPSALHKAPDIQAGRLAWYGHDHGFERLREENRAAWADLWRGRIQLHGAEHRWQAMADAAFYYLHASVHPSSPSSTSPFGLAQWYNYTYFFGHIMWDLETFTYPALMLTYPHAAQAMLSYRAQRLPAATSNAKMLGYRGLLFPWQSSMAEGEEATPPSAPSALYEQHVTLDVAFAAAQFDYAVDDDIFRKDAIWPILRGVAEWVTSRVERTKRGYEIHRVIGPAESQGQVDNDAYTNMAAAVALRAARKCAARMGYAPPPAWERIEQNMYVPRDETTHALLNYDSYAPDQPGGPTPSAAAGLYPLTYPVDAQTEHATYKHYLDLAGKYIGTPMLSTLYAVFAARLGDRKRALKMLEEGYGQFIVQPFSTPLQVPTNTHPYDGPFFANMGGLLMDFLFGLPGLELGQGTPESWCTRPVVLPEGWERIEVERIWVRGRSARLVAAQGDERARIEVTGDEETV